MSARNTSDRLVELMAFETAVHIYGQTLKDSENDPHFQHALHLMIMYERDIRDTVDKFIEPFTSDSSASFLNYYLLLAKRSGSFIGNRQFRVLLYERFLRWGMSHQGKLRKVFSSRAFTLMTHLEKMTTPTALMVISQYPSISGAVELRRWVMKAWQRYLSKS